MKTKEEILSKLKSYKKSFSDFGITTIGLFGSYIRNEQTVDSDIDILVDFSSQKETYDNLIATYDFLEEIFEGTKVELVTKKGLSRHIGPQILNEVIYV